jgi:hypothetical protein
MARQFVLEELDRNRPHGATAFWVLVAFDEREREVGDLPYLQQWDVEQAFRYFEQLGVAKVRHLHGTGNDAVFKARLTISRRELAQRMDGLIVDAPSAEGQ